MSYLPYLLSAWLFFVGLYGVVTSRHLVHLAVCLTVMQSSTYVLLLSIGYVNRATAPIFADVPRGTRAVDPVVQALTLTDVVGATGAGGYTVVSIVSLLLGSAFLHNFGPLGTTGKLASGGSIPFLNVASALEVSAAFVLLFSEFLDELVVRPPGPE